ncbi:hypothetical protein, partial [Lysinibacillus xylanilyticus]|uniref:hypothetical protein n=1 Tax=Lysinibacillus xylanilyticus TaxID=582475 RepID=UPI0036DB0614
MSNFDDDFEIEMEIDLDTSGEIEEGFNLDTDSMVSFIEDDLISSDDIAITLTSGGTFEPDTSDLEEMLLLELGEVDLTTSEEPPKFEVALTPSQTAMAVYKPDEDESFRVEMSNKEIHNALYDIGQYEREANLKIRDYLDKPIFDILPKTVRFKSESFRKQQDFRSMLVADFINYRATDKEYSEQHIIDKVFRAYEAERLPELTEQEVKNLTQLIHNFVLFANSTFDEAQRTTTLKSYEEFSKKLQCPEVVGNFTYVCKCGAEYEMPEGLPTLTFFIREVSKTPIVTLMNHTIPCETCQAYLYLPTPLVDVLNTEMQDYVKRIKATYEQPRIYRPKFEDLEQMIPSNVKDLFQLRSDKTVESVASQSSSHNTAFSNYSKLIGMWMNAVSSKHKLESVTESFRDAPEVLAVANELTRVDFGFVADLYSYQFAKTVIHYLEGFSCFSLTKEKEAYYKYCEIEGYDTKPFPVDYAKQWIYDNAPYIAGLNNIYNGDTKMVELNILPEYLEPLNYV